MKNNNQKIRKVLFNEVSFLVSVIAVVVVIVLFIVKPDAEMKGDIRLIQASIANIEENHLTVISEDIKDIQEKNELQDYIIIEIDKKLEYIIRIFDL